MTALTNPIAPQLVAFYKSRRQAMAQCSTRATSGALIIGVLLLGCGTSTPPVEPLPDGLLRSHAGQGRLSGPVCHEGAGITAALRISREAGGRRFLIELSGECQNGCLTDDINPRIVARLMHRGQEVVAVPMDIEKVPGKGFPWNGNPVRGNRVTTTFVHSLTYDAVQFEFTNRTHGGPSMSLLQTGLIILGLLGG